MTIRVAINGYGRIGRNVLRAAVRKFPDIAVVGIDDLVEPDYHAHLTRYDTAHGRFPGAVGSMAACSSSTGGGPAHG